jgi:hypothetical protein
MTQLEQNRLSMFLAVLGVMAKYNSVWTALTAIDDMVTRLTNLTTSIQTNSGVQGTPLTGIAEGKRRKRVAMVEAAHAIAGDLHALAVKNGDADLEAKTDYELSDLLETTQNLVGPLCQNIHGYAVTNAAALASDYGTTAADVTDLQTKITAYNPDIAKPREAIVARKDVTGDIAADEKTADAILNKELDKAMKKFKVKNPDFFNEYTSARMIIDLGHGPKENGGTTPPAGPPPA